MFFSTLTLVALLNCASVLTLPFTKPESLSTRQINTVAANNTIAAKMNMSGMVLTEAQKEAQEEAAEKLPGLNTIASAYKELYYHDKYGSKRHETAALVKMAGQAVGTSAPGGDPEAVSKAILLIFEPYNAKVGPTSTPAKANSMSPSTEPASLNTIAHSLHEVWEKMVESPGPKPETSMLVKAIGQAIATSSTSGDPATVAKAIEAASSKFMPASA